MLNDFNLTIRDSGEQFWLFDHQYRCQLIISHMLMKLLEISEKHKFLWCYNVMQ